MLISFLKESKKILIFAAGFMAVAAYVLSLNTALIFPSIQNDRKILSSLIYMPDSSGHRYQVMKIKNDNKIVVEIYRIIDQYNFKFISRIDTGNKYEGYFLLGGSATNLAYINIDDDPINEIIVPGFDQNLNAHLNVIKFDSTTESFTLLNQKLAPFEP